MDFKNGVALVTGGAQGIGRAVCEALLSRGCKVSCVDMNSEKGNRTVEELQKTYGESNCIFAKCDVSSFEEFEGAYLKAEETFGNLNILVNNAGVSEGNKIVDINLKGVIHGCDIALKYMGKNNGGDGGAVVNVSSVVGLQPFSFNPIYAATKSGIIALTRCYGQQEHYEKSRITFTVACPSAVTTEMYRRGVKKLINEKKMKELIDKNPPMEPGEMAEAIIRMIEEGRNGSVVVAVKGKENTYVKFNEEKYMN